MARGKIVRKEEFELVHQLFGYGANAGKIANTLNRPIRTIRDILRYETFEDYTHRNDQRKVNAWVEEENISFLDQLYAQKKENNSVQSYVDAEFKQQVMQMLREALIFRPVTEAEVMQFIENNGDDEDMMQRINWRSFTKTAKYKEKKNVEKF